MKEKYLGVLALIILILGGCNKEEISKIKGEEQKTTINNNLEKTVANSGKDVLNPYLEKVTKGKVEVIYTKQNAGYDHDIEGFKISVDSYQIVKVTDINEEAKVAFDDQAQGYVITSKVTVTNNKDKAMYYNKEFRIQLDNEYDYIPSDINSLVEEKDHIRSKKEQEIGKFAPKESVTGLITFTLTNEEFNKLTSVNPKYIIDGGIADNNEFEKMITKKGIYDFKVSDKEGPNTKFFPDRLISGNYADKKLLNEVLGINEEKRIQDIKVTLEGVQFSEVIPTNANKDLFSDFGDSGIVSINVKLKIENDSSSNLNLFSLGTKLHIDDNRGTVIADSTLEPDDQASVIIPDKSGIRYHVFLFRKDEFDVFKKFELEFGPFYGEDGSALFNDETVKFVLPNR